MSDVIDTLAEAKKELRENWEKGTRCKCCGQQVKLYRRKLYSVQARGLIELYHLDKALPGYYHISQIESQRKSGGGDFAKLLHWRLVREMPNGDGGKRTSGMWSITPRGRQFVEQRLRVPSHILLYDGRLMGFADSTVDIAEALGKRFNYTELMRNE
jgi:hypothetical protein